LFNNAHRKKIIIQIKVAKDFWYLRDSNPQSRGRIKVNYFFTQSKSPQNNAANAYNKLPIELKSIKSYQTFVKKLREFLLKKCYYSLEDYKKEIWQS